MSLISSLLATAVITAIPTLRPAPTSIDPSPYYPIAPAVTDTIGWEANSAETQLQNRTDSLTQLKEWPDTIVSRPIRPMPTAYFGPVIFDTYNLLEPITVESKYPYPVPEAFHWLEDLTNQIDQIDHLRQNFVIHHPRDVKYNLAYLPEPPKSYRAFIDPVTTKIVLEEVKVNKKQLSSDLEANIEEKHWLNRFDASLQFSQAYISPNWYQGGNNNLNLIALLDYNVKLNPKYYPNLLFEANIQYKLSLNNAPDDSIHSVNISEDIFQLNSTFGVKAAKNWFYSANLMFKTQLLNSFVSNSRQLKTSFLSPGELNLGLGMTYSKENRRKTMKFGASISPLSWNMKTCINDRINPADYGIEEGRHTVNKVGSSAELNFEWKIAYNIVYHTRLFAFSDYELFQADWEHTVDFNINRFLSTRLYVHLRYDTETPSVPEARWRYFQLKEIFSFGFSYHFGV